MHDPNLDRRALLKALGLGTAGVGLGACRSDPRPLVDERVPMPAAWAGLGEADGAVFPQGVQCGDPLPDSLILWTRTASPSCEVVVARAVDGAWVEAEPVACTVEEGGFVHVGVETEPDQPIAYQFRDGDGALSAVGHARSAPAPDARVELVLGATSCASQGHGDFPSMPAAVSQGPIDLWCWLGDTLYNDGVTTEAGYRNNWQRQLARDGFQAVLGNTACVYTWDDHEVDNDWGDTEFGAPVDPTRLATAYAAFFDHTPTRRFSEEPRRIYRSFRLGATAEVFVLDCRGERDEANGVYISDAQMQWLLDGLSASTATWKLILNSVPITNLPEIYDLDQVIRDRWEGYADQRERLLGHIVEQRIRGVLFISGDVHHGTFCRVDEPGGTADRLLEIFTGPAGSSRNPLGNLLENGEQFLWSAAVWNCTRLELHPGGWCRIHVVGEEGQTWLDTLFDEDGLVWWVDGERPE